jgi:two-component system, OmpR family, phosphate regulon sensor histidine kinase PhoR
VTLDWVAIAALVGGIILGAALARVWSLRSARALQLELPPEPERHDRGDTDGAFAGLVRALPLGVLVLDRNTRISVANHSAGAIFGFDAARAAGSHLIAAVPNLEVERRVTQALRGEISTAELLIAGKIGNRTFAVTAFPLIDKGGRVTGALVLADDRTDSVEIERARQEFMSNVSHELRTPLSSIKLMLETVTESPDDEAADLFVPQALAQVDRLVELVQQLLDQARAQSGRLNITLRNVDLESVARPIVASFEPQAASKGVALRFAPLRPVTIEADPDRLAQVFVNLIDNALRHTPEGGAVSVELDAQGADALVRVRDSGVGIPYKDLPHVFERFYVVERSRAREQSGVGLGLSIVRQIVEAHGGSIAVESVLGSGAMFTVRIPIMRVARS